ncbi:phosphomannomutase [Brachybacterium endophyticum]|uniref:Phosphomannomutase n=1 Tax=Brachybacterium endophyticum TaxID=2182385 RepID=A0A2U2RGL8_9MICO|nr:phospho-sugar mutase [Brachybacterium endophyticum]PWH05004.1 phosphomannomutase [Brachybacterium endophyticum]
MIPEQLREQARAWIEDDPDAATRTALTGLLDQAAGSGPEAEEAAAELEDAFDGTLAFGTAGLRGRMGPGSNRMNLAVVSRAARGLADFLLGELGGAGTEQAPLVVIGHDARHNSAAFALASAQIMTAAGCRVVLTDGHCPTPLIAFATRHLDADAGVVVTASHNPPADNGYKVYLGGRASEPDGRGVQIVPPSDARIAEAIAAVGPVRQIPRSEDGWELMDPAVPEAYLDAIGDVVLPDAPREVRIVHTAMHGVGGATAFAALHRSGFTDVHAVAKQADPDPDFPTVAFPNPEEKGAIDLALELARTLEADVVIANDPDADRCAAAVHDPHLGAWRMLSGDELGVLLGARLLRAHGTRGVFANSVVSSRWLSRIARAEGCRSATTLTGFKWIARTPGIVFGYEEAIGYCVLPDVVRDKDGLSTALLVAELAADARARGRSLVDDLDDLARDTGLFATSQLSIRVQDLADRDVMMARLREQPPLSLADSEIIEVQDLAEGSVATTGLPPTDGVLLATSDDARVIVRPSGTEPKLKCYIEVHEDVVADADRAALGEIRLEASAHLEQITEEMRAALTGA